MDGGVPAATGALRTYQDRFVRALLDRDAEESAPSDIVALARQPGFDVYRNTVLKGCIDAMRANYPAVARLTGDEWFRAAATRFVRAHPPPDPALVRYGDGFASFLAGFEPARVLPYLPGVARLDRFWIEAHTASDEEVADASAVAALDIETLSRAKLRPHAAARWAWFELPVFTIWQRNRAPGPIDDSAIDWHGEGALLTRPQADVRWFALTLAGCAFLDVCATGGTIADAAAAALGAHPGANLAALFAELLVAGAFASFTLRRQSIEEPST